MATLKSQILVLSSSSSPSPLTSCRRHVRFQASLQAPVSSSRKKPTISLSKQFPAAMINIEKPSLRDQGNIMINKLNPQQTAHRSSNSVDESPMSKLYAITEAAADRAEMHSIIGEQRNDWNKLLLSSINSITLSASLMSAISSISQSASTPLNVSSAIIFSAATGMMLLVNKMQPSQLAEEQRKATQLYKQLEKSIHTTIAIGSSPTETDVVEAVERVLAIDRAYPLPLLPLQDKFPKKVEPAVWWPKLKPRKREMTKKKNNGWSQELEEEMRGVVRLLKTKDQNEYRHVGEIAVKINRMLAISGPVLAGLAAVGASASSFSSGGGWPAMLAVVGGAMAVVGGAMATVVNTLEHGGQMGMVFELFRNCYGYYKEIEEEIEKNLGEREVDNREDGELFRMKIALKLGRSFSELKSLASYASPSSCRDEDIKEFAGKLF